MFVQHKVFLESSTDVADAGNLPDCLRPTHRRMADRDKQVSAVTKGAWRSTCKY